jgi:hypothetical protein
VDKLGVHSNVTECETDCAPAPEREITAGELVALLAMVTLSVKVPAADGVNVTISVAFCPGARASPAETPLVVNLASETFTLEMETVEFPALLSATLSVLLLPIATFPKIKLEELTFKSDVAATPDPLTATVPGELVALLMTETVPETLPVTAGENLISNVICWVGPIDIGREMPLTVNPGTATLACEMAKFDPPVLDTVTDCETVLPTATDPKLTDGGDIEMAAEANELL